MNVFRRGWKALAVVMPTDLDQGPQKQNIGQAFRDKWLIKEVISRQTGKGMGQERGADSSQIGPV